MKLVIDIETYSSVHIGKSGVYPYVEAPDFEILLFAYSVDDRPVQIIDLAQGERIPREIEDALMDPRITKSAFNAQFERICLSAHLGLPLNPRQWKCDQAHAAYLGLPLSLDACAKALNLPLLKDRRGKSLIKFFCGPQTGKNGKQTRNHAKEHQEKWEEFKDYCIRDVEVELAIEKKLKPFPMPDTEWENYWLDQDINDRGIRIDTDFATQALQCDLDYREQNLNEAKALTGIANPNSPQQLLEWLNDHGSTLDNLRKADVAQELETATDKVKRALELRQELSKTSTKKYEAMLHATAADGRAHGLIQFYGANRTGRYAGRLIQVQNLPRNYLNDLDCARSLVKEGHGDMLAMLYDSLPDTLSQLIRTAFIPSEGRRFLVADYSAIEARVIAWLAGETWRTQLFNAGGDIYCQSATAMFGVPVEKGGINADLRQKGKIAELACGYGGSTGALKAMGALNMGIKEGELQPLVDAWRSANPHIVNWWYELDKRAIYTVKTGQTTKLRNIKFTKRKGILFITLPSGRALAYPGSHMGLNRFGSPSVIYRGVNTSRQWCKIETYGGKLAENITQAIARDLLADALKRLEKHGFEVVMHIHDEVVIDAYPHQSLDEACSLMATNPAWAHGLPLNADGFECDFYQKD